MFTLACKCGRSYRVEADKAGKRTRCPKCGYELRVPGTRDRNPDKPLETTEHEPSRTVARPSFDPTLAKILATVTGLALLLVAFMNMVSKPAAPPRVATVLPDVAPPLAPAREPEPWKAEDRILRKIRQEAEARGWTVLGAKAEIEDSSGRWYYTFAMTHSQFPKDGFSIRGQQRRRIGQVFVQMYANNQPVFHTESQYPGSMFDSNNLIVDSDERAAWRPVAAPIVRLLYEAMQDITFP